MVQQSRLRLLLAATFFSIAAAQADLPSQITAAASPLPTSARSYPPCAEVCLAAATNALPCSESDSSCLCAHQQDVRKSVESCLLETSACTAADAGTAASYYETVCRGLGLNEDGRPSTIIANGGLATASSGGVIVPTSSATSTSSEPAPTTSSSSASESGDKSQKEKEDEAGLSVVTVAGIAVGCTFVVVAIITAFIWMYVKRRDEDDDTVREIESQSKKPKMDSESSTSSFKTPTQKASEKASEYALSSLSSQPPPPKYTRSNKPTLADRRHQQAQPLQRTPSETLNTSSYPFPFGDRRAAEASMTSLALPNSASKPVSAIIVTHSPARSQFSDQASIYSVSSVRSQEAQIQRASEARLSRPTTFYNLYSGGAEGQSTANLIPPKSQNLPVSKSQSSLRPNKLEPRVKVTETVHNSVNPFTTPDTEPKNPFDTTTSATERPNPLRSHPSVKYKKDERPRRSLIKSNTSSFGKFDFEIAAEEDSGGKRRQSSGLLRNSFFTSLDLGIGK